MRDAIHDTVLVAEYLLKKHPTDFDDVYPVSQILACDLLKAEISEETLKKYKDMRTENDYDYQLKTAARVAFMARTSEMPFQCYVG